MTIEIPATGGNATTENTDAHQSMPEKAEGGSKQKATKKTQKPVKEPAKKTAKKPANDQANNDSPPSASAAPTTPAPGLRGSNGIPCPLCSTQETPVYTKAGSSGPNGSFKTYYYCPNRVKGCRFSHQVVKPGVMERLRKQVRGERVRTPVKDGGNIGGLPAV
jgi:hypothetical protein